MPSKRVFSNVGTATGGRQFYSCRVFRISNEIELSMGLTIHLQFSGGMELLFNNEKEKTVTLPDTFTPALATLKDLLPWMRDNLLSERAELFMQGDTVRPGILVLINDADWELEGELEYVLKDDDTIVFISTLHGG
ncbi:hypothetical protein SpCBS45565_g00541 [Spizellomyces sp. 'palustris']|nr:hypothetical protein SpCBS45565_g00541 [Spizellomyces sp. 'palustris']